MGHFEWGFQAEALTLKETRKREMGVKRKTFELPKQATPALNGKV
jgi:hypothetical protein